jgi:uncharacterized membrane protein (UPF0127 family)
MPRYVRVINTTRGTVLAERCRVASSVRDRMVGLLGTAELGAGQGLLIERTQSIHMFFMRYAIDAVFIDASGRVTKVVANLPPWRVVGWARRARDCVELPAGAAAAARTAAGDRLAFEPRPEQAEAA